MTTKKQTEVQQVINILEPHICSCGLESLHSYAKFNIKEAWNKCTSPYDLLSFKLISAYPKDKKSKAEFVKVIKRIFKAIDAKIKADIKTLPQWVHDNTDWSAPDVRMMEEDILAALESDDFNSCLDLLPDDLEGLGGLDAHTIIKKYIKAPTLQDFFDIKLPDAGQSAAIGDWERLTKEQKIKLLVQYKLYDSSGKRLFK